MSFLSARNSVDEMIDCGDSRLYYEEKGLSDRENGGSFWEPSRAGEIAERCWPHLTLTMLVDRSIFAQTHFSMAPAIIPRRAGP